MSHEEKITPLYPELPIQLKSEPTMPLEAKRSFGLIPKFSGENVTSLHDMLDTIQIIAKFEKWEDSEKLMVLQAKSHGPARQYLLAQKPNTYDEGVQLLKQRYEENLSMADLVGTLAKIKQLPTENVASYFDRVTQLRLTFKNITVDQKDQDFFESQLKEAFISGLADEEVRMHTSHREPATIDIALDIARKETRRLDRESRALANAVSASNEPTGVQELIQKAVERSLAEKAPQTVASVSDSVPCPICHKTNHKVEHCWYNLKNPSHKGANRGQKNKDQKRGKWCKFCRKDTHSSSQCWSKNKSKNSKNSKAEAAHRSEQSP